MIGLATAAGYWLAAIVAFALVPWARDRSIVRFLNVGGIAGGALVATLMIAAVPFYDAIASLLVYGFLCELFVFLLTLVGGSVSVATLLRLYRGLSPQATSGSEYEHAVSHRIETMKKAGFMTQAGNRFSLTNRGGRLLKAARCLQRFFNHKSPRHTRRAP